MQNSYPLWHPCSQMKDYETFSPIDVVRAEGSYLYLQNGQKLLDANSSWWCKSLGHGHPRLKAALINQAEQLEHVILANTTNDAVMACSYMLTDLMPGLNKVFYASDGACAVEIAVKMSLQAHRLNGQKRTKLAALTHGYHGETLMASALSDCDAYAHEFSGVFDQVTILNNLPLVSGETDPLWSDCAAAWPAIQAQLDPLSDSLAAIVFEPILQGAGGMRLYSPDLLRRLRAWADQHGVHLIADEILTGFGRTGKMFACEHANIRPDFMCLGKGLTAGWLAMSAVLTTQAVYDVFYADYSAGRNFLHSHTYSGNALAAAVAAEAMHVFAEDGIVEQAAKMGHTMRALIETVCAQSNGWLSNVRGLGGIVAADLNLNGLPADHRLGYAVYQRAAQLGALLRPLGNTLYWLPPLNSSDAELAKLAEITAQAVQDVTAGLAVFEGQRA